LYESSPEEATEIDYWIDYVSSPSFESGETQGLKEKLSKSQFLAGKSLSLADMVAWSSLKRSEKAFSSVSNVKPVKEWFSKLSSLPPFTKVASDFQLKSFGEGKGKENEKGKGKESKGGTPQKEKEKEKEKEPVYIDESGIGHFKLLVAKAVAKVSGDLTPEQIFPLLEAPKIAEHGDLSLAIPKLNQFKKISKNPAALAAEWAKSVASLFSPFFISLLCCCAFV